VSDPRGQVAAEQLLVARFLADVAVERAVRADPEGAAAAHGVEVAVARRLAALDARRVAAFRASREHKARVRAGARPSRIG
jgi:hypothetical protein